MRILRPCLPLLVAASLGACGSKDAGGGANAADAMGGGPPSCQQLVTAFEKCVAEMPEGGRQSARDGLTQMQDAWKKVDKEALETLCKQALDAARQGVGPTCPNVKWN